MRDFIHEPAYDEKEYEIMRMYLDEAKKYEISIWGDLSEDTPPKIRENFEMAVKYFDDLNDWLGRNDIEELL